MEAQERDSGLAAANKQWSSSKSHGNKKNQSHQVPSTMEFFHISFSACLNIKIVASETLSSHFSCLEKFEVKKINCIISA